MSNKVSIVTDSTCCLPLEFIEQHNISVLPVGLIIEETVYRDNIDISLEEICHRIENGENQPTTAAVSPGEFFETFSRLAESTDNILCILVSKILTATQESAYQAKRQIRTQYPDLNIEIIDSKTSAGALGFIVAEAARAAQEGKTMAEVVEITRETIPRVIYMATLDTLKYLVNIGRAPRSGAIGEMLNIKPIIGFVDDTGTIEVIARVRGKTKSLGKMVDLIGEYVETDPSIHVNVHYSVNREDGEKLKDMINVRYNCAELYLTPYSPVMVSATGPMTGVSFYS